MSDELDRLEGTLSASIEAGSPDAMLFSGGIDSCALASLAFRGRRIPLVTVIWAERPGPDLRYSVLASRLLRAEQHLRFFGILEAQEASRETVRLLRLFEPIEVRNSLTTYLGLELCQRLGFRRVMTGDGADELFAGYGFLLEMPPEEIDRWISTTHPRWSFSTPELGRSLGIEVVQPFLSPEVIAHGLGMAVEKKVFDERGARRGKVPLRQIVARHLGAELAWREKAPIETGSGSVDLGDAFQRLVDDEEFERLSEEMELRDKEHALYYRHFRDLGIEVEPSPDPAVACRTCGARTVNSFCRICGTFPAIRR